MLMSILIHSFITPSSKLNIVIVFLLLIPIGNSFFVYTQEAKVKETQNTLENIKIILEYHGLKNLSQINIKDAWGSPINIQQEHRELKLTSLGSDKKIGGKG